jgi:Zn-dependent protease
LSERDIGIVLVQLPVFLFSVIVHECAHGLVALWHGDPTAKFAGRLTLNPIPHLDPFGSILFPAMLLFTSGGRLFMGWAKPVPVNVANLRHPRGDSVKVAAAGPISNLLLAFVFALVWSLAARIQAQGADAVVLVCQIGVYVNCILAVFNLLPIPPLDGHWLLLRFLPPRAAAAYGSIGMLGILLLLALFLIPGANYYLVQVPVQFLMSGIIRAAGVPQ